MKAISLWQPWATLIAVEAKRVETRHWRAPASVIGQRIAIHAAKTTQHLHVKDEEPFIEYVGGIELPLGAIVTTAVLDRCGEMTEESIAALEERNPHEAAFGLYQPGRWAWVLRDVQLVDPPLAWRGSQGFFDVPAASFGLDEPEGAAA